MCLMEYSIPQLDRGGETSRAPIVTQTKSAEPGSEHKGREWNTAPAGREGVS